MMKTFKNRVVGGGNSLFHKILTASIITILLFAVSCKNEPVYYEVRFNSNGGTVYTVQQVLEGERVLRVVDPVKDGYTFEGWYTDPKFTYKFDFNQPVYQDTVIYAKWGGGEPVTASCITFSSDGPFSISIADYSQFVGLGVLPWDGKIEYSTDLNTWTEWDGNEKSSDAGNKLYFRGTGNNVVSGYYLEEDEDYIPWNWVITGTNVSVSGNIMTLLDYDNPPTVLTPGTNDYCFYGMFLIYPSVNNGTSSLVDASKLILPATTLAPSCYYLMFANCASLKSIPQLPATELAEGCYRGMFSASGLETVPSNLLSAEKLAMKCYSGMFSDCTLLKSAPALPATQLARSCYTEMFKGCSQLREAPVFGLVKDLTGLDADKENDINGVFEGMFEDCSALTVAPTLPATKLAKSCYSKMFKNCSSLINPPVMSEDVSSLAGLDGSHTLAGTPGVYEEMFYGCESLISAPHLPAKTLANYCYYAMFFGCNSLITVPELPATNLAEWCYYYMFQYCSSLTTVPEELPATILAKNCYNNMFYGCSSLTSAPELPAKTLQPACYYAMFSYCDSLCTPPVIAAETLADPYWDGANYLGCCQNMFYGCSNLLITNVNTSGGGNEFFTCPSTIPNYAVTDMFKGTGGSYKSDPVENGKYYYVKYLTFSVTSGTVRVTPSSSWNATTKEYNNGSGWKTYTDGTITGSTVMFRGIGGTSASVKSDGTGIVKWTITGTNVSCSGNIETILNYQTVASGGHPQMDNYCYKGMFKNCTALITAPELPATTLAYQGYCEMFKGCTSLKIATSGDPSNKIFTCPYSVSDNAVTDMFTNTKDHSTAWTPTAGDYYWEAPTH